MNIIEARVTRADSAGVYGEEVAPNRRFSLPIQMPEGWHMPWAKRKILILGTGPLALDLCAAIKTRGGWFHELIGFLGAQKSSLGDQLCSFDIIGTYDELDQTVEKFGINTIVVCLEDARDSMPVESLLIFKAMGVQIVDGHDLLENASGRLGIDSLRPSALIFSRGFQRRSWTLVAKRFLDVIFAVCGLVVCLPLFTLVALLIKLDSPGPVLYHQIRSGFLGQPFRIWKFRSMRQDAEANGPQWAQANDARISRVGRWLRKLRIDELPQLVNVLKGDMSLIGPRPERPAFVQELRGRIPYYDIRHTVKPGITGWAQVKFRYGASAKDAHTKLQYDLYYVKNLSIILDLKILVHTLRVIMLGEGAH